MDEKIIKISPNIERAKSLVKSSEKTLKFAKKNVLNEENSGVLLCNYYESLIELLHSFAYFKGFKILDHQSFYGFINEEFKSIDKAMLFDKYRKIRNSVIYYGKEIDINVAKSGIREIEDLIKFLKTKTRK